jgi:hypothetical protein
MILAQISRLLRSVVSLRLVRGTELVLRVARYLRFYAVQCIESGGLSALAELIATELALLCEAAFVRGAFDAHDGALDVLLTIDDMAEEARGLRGIRRAQIRLALFYMHSRRHDLARKIAADMADEPAARLRLLRGELDLFHELEHFEIDDRGTSVDYMPPEHRAHLDEYFGWLPE